MKTKQIGLIALLAIITLALIACKEDDPKCECAAGTEHLFGQQCCEGTGCNCQVYYGVLPNTTIKIYKGDDRVTDAQMTTAVQNVIEGYNTLTDPLTGGIKKIYIISDKECSWDGENLGIKWDTDVYDCNLYIYLADLDIWPFE